MTIFMIKGMRHDGSGASIEAIRKSNDAIQTAMLMVECGYADIDISIIE